MPVSELFDARIPRRERTKGGREPSNERVEEEEAACAKGCPGEIHRGISKFRRAERREELGNLEQSPVGGREQNSAEKNPSPFVSR